MVTMYLSPKYSEIFSPSNPHWNHPLVLLRHSCITLKLHNQLVTFESHLFQAFKIQGTVISLIEQKLILYNSDQLVISNKVFNFLAFMG